MACITVMAFEDTVRYIVLAYVAMADAFMVEVVMAFVVEPSSDCEDRCHFSDIVMARYSYGQI